MTDSGHGQVAKERALPDATPESTSPSRFPSVPSVTKELNRQERPPAAISPGFSALLLQLESEHVREVVELRNEITNLRAQVTKVLTDQVSNHAQLKSHMRAISEPDPPSGPLHTLRTIGTSESLASEPECPSAPPVAPPLAHVPELTSLGRSSTSVGRSRSLPLPGMPLTYSNSNMSLSDHASPLASPTASQYATYLSNAPVLVHVTLVKAQGLPRADWGYGLSDPYCICEILGKAESKIQTKIISKTLDPEWNHEAVVPLHEVGDDLVFNVMDHDWNNVDDLLGKAILPSAEFYPNGFIGDLPLMGTRGYMRSTLTVRVVTARQSVPVKLLNFWTCDVPDEILRLSGRQSLPSETMGHQETDHAFSVSSTFKGFCRLCVIIMPSCQNGCVIMPDSIKRFTWDILGAVVLLIDLIWTPMQVFDPGETLPVQILAWTIRIYWTCDVYASFSTGHYSKDGKLVKNRFLLAIRYVKGWLCFDLTILGIDWMILVHKWTGGSGSDVGESAGAARGARLARMMKTFRLVRLMRLVKLRQMAFTFESLVDCEMSCLFFTIGKNLMIILVLNHFLACLWFAVGEATSDIDSSWVQFAELDHEDYSVQYLVCLHWSLAQFTPGATPIQPRGFGERVFSVSVLALGLVVATCFISSITSALSVVWTMNRYHMTQTTLLKKFLHQSKVSRELGARVTRYVECVVELRHSKLHASKVAYLSLLSGPLHSELQEEIFRPHLTQHPFFKQYTEMNKTAIQHICVTGVDHGNFARNDTVFLRGAVAQRMHFLDTGSLVYQHRTKCPSSTTRKRIVRLESGQWCCEPVLWMKWTHRGLMKALTHASTITLNADKFRDGTFKFPDMYLFARQYAMKFGFQVAQAASFDPDRIGVSDIPQEIQPGFGYVDTGLNRHIADLREAEDIEAERCDFSDCET